jgi:hypothetical protein
MATFLPTVEPPKIMTSDITKWTEFGRIVRSQGCNLLKRLDEFPQSILVTGCQRSGTTMLSKIITESDGLVNYYFGLDSELDGALILSGYLDHDPQGRYCFQTTYLNNCFQEYFEHSDEHKVIWVLRNPRSVVHSMLYHWKLYALDELFESCAVPALTGADKLRFKVFGNKAFQPLQRACLSYNAKVAQIFCLHPRFTHTRMIVIDYDDLVCKKNAVLPFIYQFVDLAYRDDYAKKIHSNSINKADQLSVEEIATIENLCWPVYTMARELLTPV